MSIGEQQQQERDGQHHDRHPARLIERDEHEPDVASAGVDQVRPELARDRCQTEEDADAQHEPPDRVLGPARRQHVADHREHREREHEADVAQRRVGGTSRTDRGVEERDGEPEQEATHRDAAHRPGEQQVRAAHSVEVSVFLRHGAMFARGGPATQGGPTCASSGRSASRRARVPPRASRQARRPDTIAMQSRGTRRARSGCARRRARARDAAPASGFGRPLAGVTYLSFIDIFLS